MVSSALYRYFPSRDDLLTALIIDAYDSLGETAEAALKASAGAASGERWTAVCEAIRGWALAHPHEYALIYGSPVPGYAAPATTVPAASRVGFALIEVVRVDLFEIAVRASRHIARSSIESATSRGTSDYSEIGEARATNPNAFGPSSR